MEEMISMTRNRQRYDPQSFMGPHYPNYYSNPMPSVPTSNTNIFEDYEARGLSICTQIDPNSRSSAHLSAILELFFQFLKEPTKSRTISKSSAWTSIARYQSSSCTWETGSGYETRGLTVKWYSTNQVKILKMHKFEVMLGISKPLSTALYSETPPEGG